MKTFPQCSARFAAAHRFIEPLEDRIALADADIIFAGNSLSIVEGNAHNDTLTLSGGAGGLPLTITDPNSTLSVAGIPSAILSADLHTVTIPSDVLIGVSFSISTNAGDDTLTLDFSNGNFGNFITFFGGANGGVGDKLVVNAGTVGFATLRFSSTNAGDVSGVGGLITYTGNEALEMSGNVGFLTLQYQSAAQTINVADAGGLRTLVTANTSVPVSFTDPTQQLLVAGAGGADTINFSSIHPGFAARISLDGNSGADTINVANGLPTLPGLTLRAATISTLPGLSIGAVGLSVIAMGSGIDLSGDVTVSGPLSLASIGAIGGVGTVLAPNVTANGQGGVALRLDGGAITAATGSVNGVTLTSTNNAPTLLQVSSGLGITTLSSGSFLIGRDDAIARDGVLSLGAAADLDLNGFDQGTAVLTGTGTVTNTAAALSTLTLGVGDASGTFGGSILGHLAVEKVGAGTHTLTGFDDATDGTIIRSGTLKLAGAGSAIDGSITLAGGTLAYGSSGTFTSDINIAQDSSIEVGVGEVLTLTDLITGPGGLTKSGDGKLILANELNSFGPAKVRILGGILEVATDGALGDVDNDLEINNATLAATAGFASGRNFANTGGTATIDAQVPNLTLINKAIVPADLTPTIPANLKFAFTYANTTPAPTGAIVVGNTAVSLAGGGTMVIHKSSATTIDTIELTGTTTASKLVIKAVDENSVTVVKRIVIDDPGTAPADIASIGSITLGKNVQLGDDLRDSVADLYVEGKASKLTLYDIRQYAILRLGDGLLYDVPNEKKTPDTFSNKPDLKIHDVLGPGVLIDLTPSDLEDDLYRPIGGGGLGKVEVNSWAGSQAMPGFIRTTQSVSTFKLIDGDCFVVFHLDKFRVGTGTTASIGSMTIQTGTWGGTGTDIEGAVGSFNADAFLAGATLTAGSMGRFTLDAGAFAGLLKLTDPDAAGIPAFTVNGDFTGNVVSASPLRKTLVKGDFTGNLEAPFIGSITAYAFLGTAAPGESNAITATEGSLGTLTATVGVVKNFSIVTDQVFKGFNIRLGKLVNHTVGIENVRIEAASIGNITVGLAAAAGATGIVLTGIKDSEFITTGNGSNKASAGSIGNVTVTLTGATDGGQATGILNSTFDALAPGSSVNTLGKIAVKVTGQDGVSLGLKNARFAADNIGAVAVSVSKGKGLGATASAIEGATFTATGAIGTVTVDGDATSNQVHLLQMSAGASIGAVTVKARATQFGTLDTSALLAGQNLFVNGSTAPEVLAALATANLGAVNVSGSIVNSQLVAGGALGAVTVGKDLTGSLLLAGAKLGGDLTLGGGDDSFQRAASIAAITVKGSFGSTSIAAGVNPGNTVFGDAGDSAADPAGILTKSSFIGRITLAASGLASGAATGPHQFAIQAAAIKGFKLGPTALPSLTSALYLDTALPAGEGASDVLVQIVG